MTKALVKSKNSNKSLIIFTCNFTMLIHVYGYQEVVCMQILVCALLRTYCAFWLGRYDPLGGKKILFFFFNQEKAQVGFLQFKFSNNLTKGRESVPFFDAK